MQNAYPLLSIALVINSDSQKKKRKSLENDENPILVYEPPLSKILQILIQPLYQIRESSEQFVIMEKDLVPLVDIQKKSVFYSSSEETLWQQSLA